MQILLGPRKSGKTTELIKLAEKHDLYIVTPTRLMAHNLKDQAKDLGYLIHMPITWDDFIQKKYYGTNINGFLIDQIDLCLMQQSIVPIKAITATYSEKREI